jgi:hypothetical protein
VVFRKDLEATRAETLALPLFLGGSQRTCLNLKALGAGLFDMAVKVGWLSREESEG